MTASILLFAFILYVSGLAAVQLTTGRYRMNFETHVMCTGVGLATFGLLTAAFGLFGIPLTWFNFALATVALFVLASLRDILSKQVSKLARAREEFWPEDTRYLVAAAALAAVIFALFLNGAFTSPWLIDDDSWQHAVAAKHVASQTTYHVEPSIRDRERGTIYLEPYPVTYPVLMGMLYQVQMMETKGKLPTGSMFWTLKFFNVLIVSLGIIYFYAFVKQWTGKPKTALWMTGVLCVLPCFMSHFIWSQSLSVALFFPALWAMEKARTEPRWNLAAAVVVGGICLSQPSSAFIFVLLAAIYWTVNLVYARRPGNATLAEGGEGNFTTRGALWQGGGIILGMCASLIFYVPALMKFRFDGFVKGVARLPLSGFTLKLSGVGSGVYYGLWDFLWAPASTRINQPTGVGVVLFLIFLGALALYAVRWSETRAGRLRIVALAWLVFGVLGILAEYFPISLFPHRFWVFFAIPVAVITGEFLAILSEKATGRTVVLALATGALLGGAVALWGVGEWLYGLPKADLVGMRLVAAILFTATALGGILGGLYLLMQQKVLSVIEWATFLGLTAATAGVALTSGYAKARFEGFAEWDAGMGFYRGVTQEAGEAIPSAKHTELWGYVALRNYLPRNVPVLGITCDDARLIGFDLGMPALDDDIARERKWLGVLPLEDLNEEVVKRIYALAHNRRFWFVAVDHSWAAAPQHQWAVAQKNRLKAMERVGMTQERLSDILKGALAPTPLEEEVLPEIKLTLQREQAGLLAEQDAIQRVAKLNELMKKSGLFEDNPWTPTYRDTGERVPFSVMLYRLKAAAAKTEP